MRAKAVPSKWIQREGFRLDVGPYLSGALEARARLEELSVRKDRLKDITKGHNGGIFNGPQFRRNYVSSPEHGVPFLTSGTIMRADHSTLPLLKRKDAIGPRLAYLQVRQGTSLISSSGTIGRMAYTRPDMDGMWSSQDVMKVVPDPDKIPPGYLYAYLSSKFGVPQVLSGTYGAIIPHIEPQHIADLEVPRLGEALEQQVHALVEEAAISRTNTRRLYEQADEALHTELRIVRPRPLADYPHPSTTSISSTFLQSRTDAFYYSNANKDARAAWNGASSPLRSLDSVAEVFIPGIFKRKYADDPTYGHPYITGADIFQLAPTSERYLMKKVAAQYDLVIREGMILIQEAGQLGGLIGRSVMAGRYLDGFACTNNVVRVSPFEKGDAGYLFALLASEYGVRLLSREAAGSSIPHTEVGRVKRLSIPWPSDDTRCRVGATALEATELRDSACEMDMAAQAIIEAAIQEAT